MARIDHHIASHKKKAAANEAIDVTFRAGYAKALDDMLQKLMFVIGWQESVWDRLAAKGKLKYNEHLASDIKAVKRLIIQVGILRGDLPNEPVSKLGIATRAQSDYIEKIIEKWRDEHAVKRANSA